MEEKLVPYEKARLSFGSFIVFMAIAGFSITIVSVIFQTFISLWRIYSEDPSISVEIFAKPFLSLLIDPLDAIISGIIVFPIYKLILRRYAHFGIKLFKKN